MTRATVIINPISGSGRVNGRLAETTALARDTLAAHGVCADVHVTTGTGDAHRCAREAVDNGAALVIAWGGDGTINEVGSALAFGPVPIAIVPAGSGNGLARELGIPLKPADALVLAARGQDRVIDAGEVDGELFFNMAGVGLDAAIAARFATRGAEHRGLLGYLKLTTLALLSTTASAYALHLGRERLARRALMIALANSRQYGNGALIAPAARVDDGRLELVVVEEQALARIVWRLPSLFRGTLRDSRGVLMRSITDAEIHGERHMPFHVDGEPRIGGARLRVRVRPNALRVRCLTPVELACEIPVTPVSTTGSSI